MGLVLSGLGAVQAQRPEATSFQRQAIFDDLLAALRGMKLITEK